jgi:hypothetical protein
MRAKKIQMKTLNHLSAAAILFAATSAHAEETPLNYEPVPSAKIHKHDGFYFNGALGGGYTTGSVEADPEPEGGGDSRLTGAAAAGQILLGGTPTRGLVVGGGMVNTVLFRGKVKTEGEVVSKNLLSLTSLGPFVTYYVDAHKGFHIMGHLGLAAMNYKREDIDDKKVAIGYALTAGVGYDWWIAEQWSLGVLGRFQFAKTAANVKDPPDLPKTTIIYMPLSPALLVSLTYH